MQRALWVKRRPGLPWRGEGWHPSSGRQGGRPLFLTSLVRQIGATGQRLTAPPFYASRVREKRPRPERRGDTAKRCYRGRMKLAIVGATGKTGRSLVEQALARGHEVRALCRA